MSVSSVPECTLPFCGSAKEQTNFSRSCRITAVVLGVILLTIGLTLASGVFGNFDIIPSCVCAAIGLIALAIGSCTRCVKVDKDIASDDNRQTSTNLSSLPYTPPKSDFLPYTPPKVEEPSTIIEVQTRPSAPPLESIRSESVTIVKQPTQAMPKLSLLQEGLIACVGHLSQFQRAVYQRGIVTQNIYNGEQLYNYLLPNSSVLSHPLEGVPNTDILAKWKALADVVDNAERALCSAFYEFHEQKFGKSHKAEFTKFELQYLVHISESLNPLRYCLAEGFYSCNCREDAFSQMKKHNIDKIKEPFFFKLAKNYYQEGDRSNTVKMLKEIYHCNNEKEDFFYRLAVDYYQEGDRDNAIKMIKEIYHDTDRKENFFNRLAEDYYREGNREKAIKMIKEIYHDSKKKESFFFRLAKDYCQEGDKEMAAKMLKEIYHDTKKKEAFMKENNLFVF